MVYDEFKTKFDELLSGDIDLDKAADLMAELKMEFDNFTDMSNKNNELVKSLEKEKDVSRRLYSKLSVGGVVEAPQPEPDPTPTKTPFELFKEAHNNIRF